MTITADASLSPPPLSLGRIIVLVRDYDSALAFYRAAFGARVLFDAQSSGGDRYLHIGFGDESSGGGGQGSAGAGIWFLRANGDSAARVGAQTGGEPLAVFYTVDIGAAVARAAAAGAVVVRPVEAADGARFAHVADLYGNVVVLVELTGAP